MRRAADDVAMLLAAARAELGPSPEDAERVRARVLAATVGAAAAGAAVAASGAGASAAAGGGAAAAGGVGAGAGGAEAAASVGAVAGTVGGGTLALKLGALALALGGVVSGAAYLARTRASAPAPAATTRADATPHGERGPRVAGSVPGPGSLRGPEPVTGPPAVPGPAAVIGRGAGPATVPPSSGIQTVPGASHAAPRPRAQATTTAPGVRAPPPVAVAAPAAREPPAPSTSSVAAPASPAPSSAAVPPGPVDTLARENELLRRAVSALAQGQPAAAITAIDVHRRELPDGQLAHDIAALRIQAQCRLGQHDLAARARAALLARWPSSPHLDAIDRACGAPPP
jgi:hypothetical protein